MTDAAASQPAALDPGAFPSYAAYQAARQRELTRARIRNMRATNRHLSIARIAALVGVSASYVKDVLGLPPSFPSSS